METSKAIAYSLRHLYNNMEPGKNKVIIRKQCLQQCNIGLCLGVIRGYNWTQEWLWMRRVSRRSFPVYSVLYCSLAHWNQYSSTVWLTTVMSGLPKNTRMSDHLSYLPIVFWGIVYCFKDHMPTTICDLCHGLFQHPQKKIEG